MNSNLTKSKIVLPKDSPISQTDIENMLLREIIKVSKTRMDIRKTELPDGRIEYYSCLLIHTPKDFHKKLKMALIEGREGGVVRDAFFKLLENLKKYI